MGGKQQINLRQKCKTVHAVSRTPHPLLSPRLAPCKRKNVRCHKKSPTIRARNFYPFFPLGGSPVAMATGGRGGPPDGRFSHSYVNIFIWKKSESGSLAVGFRWLFVLATALLESVLYLCLLVSTYVYVWKHNELLIKYLFKVPK